MGNQREAAFYDRLYAREPKRARSVTYRRHKEVARWVTGETVLDFGCGVALIADMIGGREYLGIDFSREAIEASQRVVDNPNAGFIVADITEFDPVEIYDTVLMIEILEHLADPKAAVDCALAHCEKQLVLTVPRDMDGPSHVKSDWNPQEIVNLVGELKTCYLFGGPDGDWWWLAVKEVV